MRELKRIPIPDNCTARIESNVVIFEEIKTIDTMAAYCITEGKEDMIDILNACKNKYFLINKDGIISIGNNAKTEVSVQEFCLILEK